MTHWNTEHLSRLVGEDIMEEILMSNVKWKNCYDEILWKPNLDGRFTIALAWKAILLECENLSLMKSIE